MKRAIISVILGAIGPMLTWCGNAGAQALPCDISYFSAPGAATGTILGPDNQRTYFAEHGGNCGPDGCRQSAYLIPGDRVLIATPGNGWACAFFHGPKRDSFGWLRLNELSIQPADPSPSLSAWAGHWSPEGWQLNLAPGPATGTLTLTLLSGDRWQGTAKPQGNIAQYTDQNCVVRLELVGDWLVVKDNAPCGDRRTNNTGIYTRTPTLARPSPAH